MVIEFFVDGVPKAQPRPQVAPLMRNGKCVFGKGGRPILVAYNPKTADVWKNCVRLYARGHAPKKPLEDVVCVKLRFQMPRPKNHYGTGRNAGVLKAGSPTFHTSTPDVDNLAKAVLDVLTEMKFWGDDSQIAICRISKVYASNSGVFVRVSDEIGHEE